MESSPIRIMLADDDIDDRNFFKEALEELGIASILTMVADGVTLMHSLSNMQVSRPDVLFLDLNMPRKNGFECLQEIKADEHLKSLPIIILSTSSDHEVMHLLYDKGAQYYIRKPPLFQDLKKTLQKAISRIRESNSRPAREHFVLTGS